MAPARHCEGCLSEELSFDFTMAFQPIIDIGAQRVWGYEALVRGREGQSAASILERVTDKNRYHFDQACRIKAVELAGKLFPSDDCHLSVNFQPGAVYEPSACIQATLRTARKVGFDPRRLMFEFTENEPIVDVPHLQNIVDAYRRMGFLTAIDDFGAGHAGLNLLAILRPQIVKIDMQLIRDLDQQPRKRAILQAVAALAPEIGATLLAEGVETQAELAVIRDIGITLVQGYLFAKPEVENLPAINWPAG